MNRTTRLREHAPRDREQWQKLYYRHQAQRPRRRLVALKAIWDGLTMAEVCRTQQVRRKTLEHGFDRYLHGGFKRLLAPERRRVPQALSPERRRVLRDILLHTSPADFGLESDQWTARRAQALIENTWNIHLGLGRVYPLFHPFGWSRQRVHRDYGPAQPEKRAAYVETLKKVAECPPDGALIGMDEFSLQSVPDTHYAWAERNAAPTVPSDERNRKRLKGFLTVDLVRGTTDVQFRPEAKTDDVVFVLVLMIVLSVQRGYHWITLIVDHARTHRDAMKDTIRELLTEIATLAQWDDLKRTTVEFLHTPPYSPAYHPAEYLIHGVRQDALYHLPITFTLADKADRVHRHLAQGPPLTPEQLQNLLGHIDRLPRNSNSIRWPKLE